MLLRLRLLLAALLLATSAQAGVSRKIFAFGDSLSDTGNSPAGSDYYQGRWSNGPVWVEYLAQNTNADLTNYAKAGTTSSDLARQVASIPPGTDFTDVTCTVWSGGNDVINAAVSTVLYGSADWPSVIQGANVNIAAAVLTLYAKGARNIVVPNVADIGKLPGAYAYATSVQRALVTGLTTILNRSLKTTLAAIRARTPGLILSEVDAFGGMQDFIANAASYGFTETEIDVLHDPSLADQSFNGPGANYLFWDQIHPTTKAHALIASLAADAITFATALNKAAGFYYSPVRQGIDTVGYIQLALDRSGTFTARLVISPASYPIVGTLDPSLAFHATANGATLNLSFTENVSSQPVFSGDLQTASATFEIPASTIVAGSLPAGVTSGQYNLALPGSNATGAPQGTGWCGLSLSPGGGISAIARLPDGNLALFGSALRVDGTAFFYAPIYGTRGASGDLAFDTNGHAEVAGSYALRRPAGPSASAPFGAGFQFSSPIAGEHYVAPSQPIPLTFTSAAQADLKLTGAGLSGMQTQGVAISNAGLGSTLTPLNFPAGFTLFKANGYWLGTVAPTGSPRSGFDGLVFPKTNRALGLFGGATQSGTVELVPR